MNKLLCSFACTWIIVIECDFMLLTDYPVCVGLISYIPVNNFSVMLRQVFLG